MKNMLVRREYFGNLIWSDTDKCYFVPINKEIDEQVNKIINDGPGEAEVIKELEEMGLRNGVRYIESNNSNSLSAPLECYFDYTNACNLRCSHCYNREFINFATMDEDEIDYVIQDLYNNGVMRLHLAGGEPTLFPEKLERYMATAKKYGIVTSMSSNGTLVSDEIANIIEKNDVTSFTISVESADEKKNAKIRGNGILAKSIEGIRKIVEYRDRNKSKFYIAIKMSYDVHTTEKDFKKMIKLSKKLKVDTLKLINPERCEYHEKGYYSNHAKEYYSIQKIIRKLQEKNKSSLNITMVNSPVNNTCSNGLPNMKGCIGAQELIAINPDGNVTPCLMNKYDLGNIFKDEGIKNIYSGEKINTYNNSATDYNCEECIHHKQCRGGCQVRKVVEYGKITSIDPLCPLKNGEETKEINNEPQKYNFFIKINVYHSL